MKKSLLHQNISLKWRILIFFILFGLFPLGVVSYLTIKSYTHSVNSMTDKYVGELIQRTANQTDTLAYIQYNHLDILAKYPFVQLSFLQYHNPGQLATVREKLELFRLNTNSFERISLYANDGHVVTTTPDLSLRYSNGMLVREQIITSNRSEVYHDEIIHGGRPSLVLHQRVYDYHNPKRPVGLIVAEASLDKLLDFTQQLQLGKGVEKTIANSEEEILYQQGHDQHSKSKWPLREFYAQMPLLDWTLTIRIPENVLLKDVRQLTYKIWTIAGFVALVTLMASLIFSRWAIRPLQQIIAGTKEFAAGHFDYRIHIDNGVETRQVAEAFNTMADELKQRQAELVQAGKLASLGLLTAGFAHEICNPLASLKISAQALARRSTTSEARQLAESISEETDRLKKIVTDLLNFSRPQKARMQACQLREIVDKALNVLGPEIQGKRIQLVDLTDSYWIFVDSGQLVQVLINLLLNALAVLKAESGRIRLKTVLTSEDEFELSIEDNGCGIPAEKLANIFDPFFSLSAGGSGLGLSIVHTLTRQNSVRIQVESEEGQGTTIRLIFKIFKEAHYG